ncbi:MAG: response regulator [SAR324 cluster bacterium]|nr:response regulator [SAR324 cluster bacterium]MBF0350609.1 response regulator [SAR324 cluster bacterium]
MHTESMGQPVELLLVEDNPDDVFLAQEALKEGKIKNNLHVVNDGESALRFLRKENPYQDAVLPDLVLLDLNLPGIDGRQVLKQIREDPRFTELPVIVLTTSESADDIHRMYKLHVNSYIVKPVDFEQFIKVIKSIENFWLTFVKLPTRT